jgi:folate-binding protein YgfZ
MSESTTVCPLEDFGVLRFRGAEAHKFLQGQLSNDVAALRAGTLLRAGLHNPQGRTLALLWLLAGDTAEVLAVTPLELLPAVHTALRRVLLRSKLTISDDSAHYRIYGMLASDAGEGQAAAYDPHDGRRKLLLQRGSEPPPDGATMARDRWRALDIAAGLPQVYAATSALFVAQMLNLDCINAISFTKGCYTGQEVIARAHYRGRVKRRMQRFLSQAPVRLAAGDAGRFDDGRSFRVVDAVYRDDARCEFLAVAALPGQAQEAPEPEPAAAAAAAAAQPPVHDLRQLACSALPLPYALPD